MKRDTMIDFLKNKKIKAVEPFINTLEVEVWKKGWIKLGHSSKALTTLTVVNEVLNILNYLFNFIRKHFEFELFNELNYMFKFGLFYYQMQVWTCSLVTLTKILYSFVRLYWYW